ncbi:GTP-binding protein [Ornatilinea apprima]|uniref:GTP-binding protein n=1 Tax=Ornatilinea apprima TaxID=1134406 RepID=A0A0P6XPM6_9CHLR|nr:GTPase [Ornatilinea apprima]KPL74141.1 GTP-binding protein [Ornatilinea apprima]
MSVKLENDFAELLKQKLEEALNQRGKVNIVVAGKTGVGKSTLVNAVFQGNLAETGDGRPVTKTTREINKEGIPLSIFDTRGLEVSEYHNTVHDLEKLIQDKKKSKDPNQHIHIAWVCVMEGSRRVEDAEIKLVEMLDKYIPVVGVITKSMSDSGFRHTVQELLPQTRNVVRVLAKETVFDGGYTIPAMGLDNLVELTMTLVPETQRDALAAAQKVSLNHKLQRAHTVVGGAAITAGGAGAVPLPFSDALAIIPIQISMLASISAVWGLPISTAFLGTLVSGAITGSAGTLVGRATAGALLKLIPGIGSTAGGAISAGVASTLTIAFGEAYITALYVLTKDDPSRIPTAEEIRDEFMRQLKSLKKEPAVD